MNRLYLAAPDGLCGDEDNGQTSAWYVFSAMGFYPVCPGSNQYVIGSPLFKKVTLSLENGNTFIIEAHENNEKNSYIAAAKLNGNIWTKNYLNHFDILKGGKIDFIMSDKPEVKRGTLIADYPFSLSE